VDFGALKSRNNYPERQSEQNEGKAEPTWGRVAYQVKRLIRDSLR
jgi:hypothetical protein